MSNSDRARLSVALVDVAPGHEADFRKLVAEFGAILLKKQYGRVDTIQDEAVPLRYYAVRYWADVDAAERCHADPDVQAITARLYQIARVTHVVNGARRADRSPSASVRPVRVDGDRRSGLDRRRTRGSSPTGADRRQGRDRRIGRRREGDPGGAVDLVAAARLAREHASAAYSKFKVGAALETFDGVVVTGCNVENATYGLTICAERVAMFKAISEGHRAFSRIAIVADTAEPTPPCGACRQILWEFAGNLEIQLANLESRTAMYRLQDLLPMPFDARLL